jgi:hypothetical protein
MHPSLLPAAITKCVDNGELHEKVLRQSVPQQRESLMEAMLGTKGVASCAPEVRSVVVAAATTENPITLTVRGGGYMVEVRVQFRRNGVERKPGRVGTEKADWRSIGQARKRKREEVRKCMVLVTKLVHVCFMFKWVSKNG